MPVWAKKISSVIETEEKVAIELNERDGGGPGFIPSDRTHLKLVIDHTVNPILEFKIMQFIYWTYHLTDCSAKSFSCTSEQHIRLSFHLISIKKNTLWRLHEYFSISTLFCSETCWH